MGGFASIAYINDISEPILLNWKREVYGKEHAPL